MNVSDLFTALDAAHVGTPEQCVESAIAVYLAASGEIDAYTVVKDSAKKLISDVMTETAQTAYSTKAGKANITAPSQSVSYDAKALDALAASSDEFARLLAPHRKVSERAGTMRIAAAK
jgi:hypothetical protein